MTNTHITIIIACLHGILFLHLVAAFGRGKWLWLVVPWLLIMGMGRKLHNVLGYDTPLQQIFAWMESIWIPYALGMLVLFLLADIVLLLRQMARILQRKRGQVIAYRRIGLSVVLISFVFVVYALWEAHSLRVSQVTITTVKPLPQQRIRLVFVSDIHINSWIGPRMVAMVTRAIEEQQPDIILLGGDTVDRNMAGRRTELELLRQLEAPCGKFAVLGNHDVAWGIAQATAFHEEAGFHLLRHEAVDTCGITIAGVDDPHVRLRTGGYSHDPVSLLRTVDTEAFTILLKHRPGVVAESVGRFDLQLSGHSHGGQIWPLSLAIDRYFKSPAGLSPYDSSRGKSQVYITTGSGFARMPMRFLVPPEIVVVDIIPEEAA